MDGTLLATQTVETKPSGLVYFNPYSEEEFRLYLPEGDHVFRAGFIDDVFVKTLPERGLVQPAEEQVSRLDHLRRTVPGEDRKGKPEEDPLLQSRVGPACVEKILATSRGAPTGGRRHARKLIRFCGLWISRSPAGSPSSRDCSSPSRRCWSRRTSCSASSAIRIRATPRWCTSVAVRARFAPQLLPLELDAGRGAAGARGIRQAERRAGARSAGQADAGRPARRRRSPRTSPASGSRRATSTP